MASASYERALILHQQRRFADAENELRQVLSQEPHNSHAHAMLGLCLGERKELKAATESAQAAIGLTPDLPFAHYVLAKVLLDRDRYEEAETAINEAIRLSADNAVYFAMLASIRMAQRRWPDALSAAEQGLALDPENPACVNLRAMALVKLGRKEAAAATIGAALQKDPQNAHIHANQGWALLHSGEHRQALEHFREALRLDPELDWARAGMVEALKARYVIYRVMLRYFLWMSRLSAKAQWGVIIGLYLGTRLLRGVADVNPTWKPYVFALLIAYMVFALLTWLADPLFNLLLRMNRFGRLALSRDQRHASSCVGILLTAAVVSLAAWFAGYGAAALLAAFCFAFVAPPTSIVYRIPPGWPRMVMGLYAAGMGVIGAAALIGVTTRAFPAEMTQSLISAFIIALFLDGWVANALLSVRVKR